MAVMFNVILNKRAWYLDDGTLCGSANDLRAALAIIEEDGPARGLHLNRAKSLLHIPVDDPLNHNPLPADIPTTRGVPHRPCFPLRVNHAQKGNEGTRDSR